MARVQCPMCDATQQVDEGVAYYLCRKCEGTNYMLVHQCGAKVAVPADERGRLPPLWLCLNCGQQMRTGEAWGSRLQRWGAGMEELGKTIQGIVGAVILLFLIYAAAQCSGAFE